MYKFLIVGVLSVGFEQALGAPTDQPEAAKVEAAELFEAIPSVYEASKYDQKLTKAPPSSLGVVTADEIKKYGYRNFGEIISSLKGFYNTSDRNYGYIGARGFGLPSDYNTRLLLLIDGHRFNDNIYDSFDTSEGFPVDVDLIERVEVVRGPSSSLYGTSAFFGVINVITKRGRDQAGANIKASYGSNDAYKTSFTYGNRFQNGLEALISGSFYHNQGYRNLYYKEFDSPATNYGIAHNLDEEQARKLTTKLAYGDFTLQALYVNRDKAFPTAAFSTVFNRPGTGTVDESTYIDLKYDHTFTNQVNLQGRISYNQYRYRGTYPLDYAQPGAAQPFIVDNKDYSRGQWWRAELNATKLFLEDHKITAGAEFQHNFDQFQNNADLTTIVNSLESSYKWALLLQDEYAVTEQLTFNTGVRLDYFSIFGYTVNPRAGLVYQPWDDTTLKLLYGTAFRAPNEFEQHYRSPFWNSNADHLKPEKLKTLEFIIEHYFDRQLRGELSLFRTEISDIIIQMADAKGMVQNLNRGNMEAQGVELQLEDNWGNGFQGRLSYSWQHTVDKATGARVSNSPEHMLKLNLIAPLWQDKVFLGFETKYMSSRITSAKGKVADHILTNINFFTQKWLKGVELSAGVYNLFNIRYYDPGADTHRQNGIQQDGLTFRVKASVDF